MAIAHDRWLNAPLALVALGAMEAELARYLAARLPHATLHVHASVPRDNNPNLQECPFERIADCLAALFPTVPGIVVLAPTGVVVRSLAPLLESKYADPAIVVVDALGRYAISLLSGHEGGANALSLVVAELLDAEPVITTTTDAIKRHIVGVGCRRGTSASDIVLSVRAALTHCELSIDSVRWLVSADVKCDEPGLRAAAEELGLHVRFISSEVLRRWSLTESQTVKNAVDLPAVAEPSALYAGTRTRCLMQKTVFYPGVTVAIAEESSPWSALAPAVVRTERIEPNGRF